MQWPDEYAEPDDLQWQSEPQPTVDVSNLEELSLQHQSVLEWFNTACLSQTVAGMACRYT